MFALCRRLLKARLRSYADRKEIPGTDLIIASVGIGMVAAIAASVVL